MRFGPRRTSLAIDESLIEGDVICDRRRGMAADLDTHPPIAAYAPPVLAEVIACRSIETEWFIGCWVMESVAVQNAECCDVASGHKV